MMLSCSAAGCWMVDECSFLMNKMFDNHSLILNLSYFSCCSSMMNYHGSNVIGSQSTAPTLCPIFLLQR